MSNHDQSTLLYTDLGIAEELSDKGFRDQFFRTEREIDIPAQLKNLRKLRQLTQDNLAEKTGMKQSAICRIERSRQANWELETLVKMAEALDARLSVVIEPYEVVAARYKTEARTGPSAADAVTDAAPKLPSMPPSPRSQRDEGKQTDERKQAELLG